jgi:hypothetical protein
MYLLLLIADAEKSMEAFSATKPPAEEPADRPARPLRD